MTDQPHKDKSEERSEERSDDSSRPSFEQIAVGPTVTKVVLDDAKLDGAIVRTGDDDLDNSANPFADPQVRDYFIGVYEEAKYECRHIFDAAATWTEEEERKIVRRLDWHVCLWACIMFFSLQIDRGNLSQAVSGTFLTDLHLNTNDYNLGNIVFKVSFLLAELPSQLISKKFGPDRWIPTQMVLWSIVAMAQAGLQGKPEFLATRSLLGMLEGGFIPDLVLWLSYFYTSRELPIRLSFFWTALSITGIIASLLAYGIFHLEGHHGLAGWRWIFLIEGAMTLAIGIVSFFLMPASAAQTKTWFRPKGWFTDRELTIVVNRVLRDDPRKGDMHNRQAITPSRLWSALKDYDLWPLYMIGLICYVPAAPPAAYLTQILRNLGFSTFNTNLLTIPSSVTHMITLLSVTWLSERINQRAYLAMLQDVWTLPCIIALRFWPGLMKQQWATYGLLVTLLSYPYCHAINVAWVSRNSNNVASRSVSAALFNMNVQLGGIISSNIYRDDDKPLYRRGNQVLIGINVLSICLFLFAKVYYVTKNKIRDRKWNAMTPEERIDYTYNTTDTASRRLDFRFAH
ncbi:MFS general substrate transporter [Eremomyces bilateralis CBS 781.70]|uniref:MFS general substrate transporter n=1 Tax=Eremomyces bilateralis CBS 781.70 TaxID=1392243 RepID=A0A6G1FZM7_9PEZI|nr:MFS general substrate transporter [Eremomyces bilateralis CBS 781.70]KAF1811307.1 MFS general substrate transporter [Eremomyces bilateralis CBS 781.70]